MKFNELGLDPLKKIELESSKLEIHTAYEYFSHGYLAKIVYFPASLLWIAYLALTKVNQIDLVEILRFSTTS